MGILQNLENGISDAWDSTVETAVDSLFGGGGSGAAPSKGQANAYPERMHPSADNSYLPQTKILGMSPLVLGGASVALLVVLLMVRK